MVAGLIVVKILILSSAAAKRTFVSHDNDLGFWIRILLNCHIPQLFKVFIKVSVILIFVWERAPAFF